MNDVNGNQPPDTPADRRDERVAALLEVPPLDEVTRRRLVSRALDAAPSRSRWRAPMTVAAAILALIVVAGGVVALVSRDNGTSKKTATREHTATSGTKRAASETPQLLGDLGDVSDDATLRSKISGAFEQRGPRSAADANRATPPAPACSFDVPEATTVEGAATGTVDGRPVSITILAAKDGRRSAVVCNPATNTILRNLPL
jgi:hypothetical protein